MRSAFENTILMQRVTRGVVVVVSALNLKHFKYIDK